MGRVRAVMAVIAAALLAAVLGGCNRAEPYLDVFRQLQATWEETAKLLAGVTDAESMEAAKDRFAELTVRAQSVARKAQAMGRPPDEVLEQLAEQRDGMQRAVNRVMAEIARVRQLPGGDEFVKDIEEIARGSR
jgi:cytochrome c556